MYSFVIILLIKGDFSVSRTIFGNNKAETNTGTKLFLILIN
jgi:hypothetical protein